MKNTLNHIKILFICTVFVIISCSDGDDSGSDGSGGIRNIEGCTDSFACNYNENATISDSSCLEYDCNEECGGDAVLDCAGECGGDATTNINEGCELPNNTFYLLDDSMLYNSNVNIAGYQFDIFTSSSISASGGDTEINGLNISTTTTENIPKVVLAFDTGGSFIPIGCGILVNVSISGSYDSIENIVVSNQNGISIPFEYYDCSK